MQVALGAVRHVVDFGGIFVVKGGSIIERLGVEGAAAVTSQADVIEIWHGDVLSGGMGKNLSS